MLLTPPPLCPKLSHLLGPPPPSSVTYFMDVPPWKNPFFKICLEKSIFYGNLPGKIEFLLPGSTTPKISNQIDASEFSQCSAICLSFSPCLNIHNRVTESILSRSSLLPT